MKLKFFTIAALIGAGTLYQSRGVAAFEAQPVEQNAVLAELELHTQPDSKTDDKTDTKTDDKTQETDSKTTGNVVSSTV